MDFLTLYGTELSRELASTDTTVLFTTARRKAAINAGQLEFLERTECFSVETAITLTNGTQEYDIEASIATFFVIGKAGLVIKIVSGTKTRYIEGDDLLVTTVARLNQEEPGWRAVSAGTPHAVYIRPDGGRVFLGFHPKPKITGSDTWTAELPSVTIPADMTADADEPFTITSNPVKSFRPYHRALKQ